MIVGALSGAMAHATPCDGLAWTTFRWSGRDRGAIFVPVAIDGRDVGWFQLDTGSNGSIVYGHGPATHVGEPGTFTHGEPVRRVDAIAVGVAAMEAVPLFVMDDMNGSRRSAGTIGADVLAGSMLVLDYPNARFAIATGQAAEAVRAATTLGPAEDRGHRLFVPVVAGETELPGVFFDSGSSRFDLVVSISDWRSLTGLAEAPANASVFTGQQWGKTVRWIGAPLPGLTIGGVRAEDPVVWYQEGVADPFADYPSGERGIVGNRALWDRILVADFGAEPGFGVLTCP